MPLSFGSRFLTETFFDTYVSLRKSGQRLAPCGLHAKWPTKLRATQGGELTRKVVPMKSICCRHPRKLSGIALNRAPRRTRPKPDLASFQSVQWSPERFWFDTAHAWGIQ